MSSIDDLTMNVHLFQADLTKLVGKLCDELQQKKSVKRELQNRIQKLKVTAEVLRNSCTNPNGTKYNLSLIHI